MKQLLATILVLSCSLSYAFDPYAEDPKGEKILTLYKTYHITKDKAIVTKTIKIINDGLWDEGVFEMRFKAFFSELFAVNETVKNEFENKLSKIKNADFIDVFEKILASGVADIYANAPQTPDVNEMLCYSYYANGNTKYIDQLLEKAKDNEERTDLNRFMIGANALWWLATLKAEDENVEKYLQSLTDNQFAVTALKSRAYDLKNEQLQVLQEQKKNKNWK